MTKKNIFFGLSKSLYSTITTALFFIVSLIYLYFILKISQFHYSFEILIALVFPILGYRFFQKADNWIDIKRLILLETGFNILCIITKVSADIEVDYGIALNWAFAIFFIFQTGGFLISEVKKKKYKCLPSSIAMGIGLAYWFISSFDQKTIVTLNREVQFLGGNAPMYLQVMYTFWVANIFFVEFRQYLPKATMYVAHAATMVIALSSNEFFHARILTASHLFIISAMVPFKEMEWQGRYFSVIPSLKVFKDDTHFVAITFPQIMNTGTIATLIYGVFFS